MKDDWGACFGAMYQLLTVATASNTFAPADVYPADDQTQTLAG